MRTRTARHTKKGLEADMNDKDLSKRLRDKLWNVGEELAEIREHLRERKTERLQLRVTPTEKGEVDSMTELLGVSTADYLMHLHRRAVKELDKKNEGHSGSCGERRGRPKARASEDSGAGEAVPGRSRSRRAPSKGRRPHGRRRGGEDEDERGSGVGAKL